MFVYQNANRDICVTFKSGMPVKEPEYVISIDHENGVIKVNGEEVAPVVAEESEAAVEPAVIDEPEQVAEPENTETEDDGEGVDETEE